MDAAQEEIVERLRSDLVEAERELSEEATHPPEVELGGGSPGYATWEAAVALRPQIEARIERIRSALARAEAGMYGICEYCGARIDPERLVALPWTTHCIDCAAKVHPHDGRRP
jgi:RNA polymerase-binding transcription factor DksA